MDEIKPWEVKHPATRYSGVGAHKVLVTLTDKERAHCRKRVEGHWAFKNIQHFIRFLINVDITRVISDRRASDIAPISDSEV